MTFPGIDKAIKIRKPPRGVNRSKFKNQEAFRGGQAEFKPYIVGMQVSFGMDSQISEKRIIKRITEIPWAMIQGPCHSEGESDFRRVSEVRPRTHADLNSSQVFGCASGGVSPRGERHPGCVGLSWKGAQEKEDRGPDQMNLFQD